MDTKGLLVDLIGFMLVALSFVKLFTLEGKSGLALLSQKYNLPFLLWVDNNFAFVFILAIGLIFMLYRGQFIFNMLKNIFNNGFYLTLATIGTIAAFVYFKYFF